MDEGAIVKAIAIVSGGLDSVTLAYLLASRGYELHIVSFDYGQRHVKELEYARHCTTALGASFDLVDLSGLLPLLRGSALTDDVRVPDGHYTAPSMAATIVPNRNAIMLSIAYAAAVSSDADIVGIGVHSGDHPIYPDCRPEFINQFEKMEGLATDKNIRLYAPFLDVPKSEIIKVGILLEVDYRYTWSCYKGGEVHCGTCGTCVERREAFILAGVKDPTTYQIP